MKKRATLSRILSAILMLAVIFSVCMVASADTQEEITAEWVTSQDSYSAYDEIRWNLVVASTFNNEKIVKYSVELPEGIEFYTADPTNGEVVIGTHSDYHLTWYRKIILGGDLTPDNGGNTEDDKNTGDVVVEEEGTDGVNVLNIVLWSLLGIAVIGGVVFVFIKRKGVTAMIAIILCAGVIVPIMTPLEVKAEDEDKVVTASKTITYDGKEQRFAF